jgi:excinuclease ABC subunit A
MKNDYISVQGAKEHNLKNINVTIPKYKFVVITGVSGSGKSSLAFDTIYAEGQRRYVESLSPYARQFLEMHDKPDVEYIMGLSPAIAIDQKTSSRNPRSTVATATDIYDYMRVLFARIGIPYSPATGLPIEKQPPSQIVEIIRQFPVDTKLALLAPIIKGIKGEHRREFLMLQKQGYERFKVDGVIYDFESLPPLDKNKKHTVEVVVDRLVMHDELGNRLAESVEAGLRIGGGVLYVEIVGLPESGKTKYNVGEIIPFSERFSCPVSGFTITEIEPRLFSFNSPYGACKTCDGLGVEMRFDENLIIPNTNLSLEEGAIHLWSKHSKLGSNQYKNFQQILATLATHYNFSMATSFHELPENIKQIILHGSGDELITFVKHDGLKTSQATKPFEGVIPYLEAIFYSTNTSYWRDELANYQSHMPCSNCHGYRLSQEALCVKVDGKNIGQVAGLTIIQAIDWFDQLSGHLKLQHQQIASRLLKEIISRLHFLKNVGLEYLRLNRSSGTLSGGESQRIRLASQIGSGLSGVLYVLDEPSIGLHQCDNLRLLRTLEHLRDLGNTVIVVEHDEETMVMADYIIDVGLGAGVHGGEIIATGTPEEVAQNPNSITGRYLAGIEKIEIPPVRRTVSHNKCINIVGAKMNNLQNINVQLPLGLFVAVTGVSGSGKSSLIIHTLYKAAMKKLHNSKDMPGEFDSIKGLEYIDKVIEIDQSPIGRTPRSNPATYTGAFTPIRDWFAGLHEAKIRGYKPGRFSFNIQGGRCEICEGDGMIKIEMHFLPDVYVKCDACQGLRYNRETLEIKYKNNSIADVLDMTVEKAMEFFVDLHAIHEKLLALNEVGLGYMKIGQSATTLSGGEAQRVKLAKELSKRSTGRTLYILDEPTTGLHSHDIKRLLSVLQKLVAGGNTVLVIEHNLDVIKTADYIVDIGPYGGDKGGHVVATGTPEEVANVEESLTGQYLKKYTKPNRIPIQEKLASRLLE